jgi:hypothetical protein
MAWDERRARYLTRQGEWALRRLRSKVHGGPREFSARLEVLLAQKRAAYESRNMEHYEAALKAIIRQVTAD